MIGGSPLLSALFHDEPTIDALERLGLGVSSVGNHEFDEGPAELRRIVDGGCHPEDGCSPGAINAAMIRDVEFHDELPVIERYSRELPRQDVRAQVVLIHEGESVKGQAGAGCDDGGPGAKLGGRIKEIAERAVPAVDLIVSGHSHFSYECTVKVALNEFLANGGNGFTVFGDITAREGGEVTDLNALVNHLETTTSATSPAAPPAPGRITFVAR
ncbi:hypothetical protein ACFQ6B_26005 [Streptomyces wedmorensis]|uniref:Calcineurin-like phosphoesterase domain-containing protein n=1 Tax=Streptomyces wedmorensis TaxID=43759 RepID=A0ABW6J941_STRWE